MKPDHLSNSILEKRQSVEIPILVIGYNRSTEIRFVLDHLEYIDATRLYIALDGPKGLHDKKQVMRVRNIVAHSKVPRENIFYNNTNSGCREFPIAAITWFFEQVEIGVIVEDDVLIHRDFPAFSSYYLSRYGNNIVVCSNTYEYLLHSKYPSKNFFSKIPCVWGWSTSKEVWSNFLLERLERNESLAKYIWMLAPRIGVSKALLFGLCLRMVDEGSLDAWDYEFMHYLVSNNIQSLYPGRSMSTNIGYGDLATHNDKASNPTTQLRKECLSYLLNTEPITLNYAYMNQQALNTPFYAFFYLHIAKGLIKRLATSFSSRIKLNYGT
jgi:hypothetical protein